mmetsp:Transcript_15265/g.22219  ORF Transcript_15265/g.22219 Transcript_15265/m.22219 type:complete len:334 (-) Transcript_15265:453-1454(-)
MDSDEEIKLKKGKKEKMETKSKKEKKKRKRDEADAPEADTRTKDKRKEEKKKLKEQKKAEKEDILKKVPKLDENGIAYTKLQIKRMVKRFKRGLDPIETEEEERERLRDRKREEMETEAEFADMIVKKDTEKEASDNDEDKSGESEEEDSPKENGGEDDENGEEEVTCPIVPVKARPSKKPRSKPVPADYTCFACKNKHKPAHWIYDCPDKLYQPGYREVKKSKRGVTEPSSRKVFVTGLPFNARSKDVKMYFEKDMKCGKVSYCKLLIFEDTKRCKGNGFITFESDEGARNALKLDRTEFQLGGSDNKKDSKDKKEKKSLWLGVKKVRNRAR